MTDQPYTFSFLGKPVTPERVLRAYEVSEADPIQEEWFRSRLLGERNCACALGAIILAEVPNGEQVLRRIENDNNGSGSLPLTFWADELQTDLREVGKFIDGFDSADAWDSKKREDAHDLGMACQVAVTNAEHLEWS